jgi:hypothetical protein
MGHTHGEMATQVSKERCEHGVVARAPPSRNRLNSSQIGRAPGIVESLMEQVSAATHYGGVATDFYGSTLGTERTTRKELSP